ncbi:hypothetical protein VTJ04DRAFT_10591 [Mycothermus thermophilus]|uniref:40S ribosomal eS30 domain-containing protein n=1 Tax=Humicola insolens TaxID=85995 RepID=UPI0037444306
MIKCPRNCGGTCYSIVRTGKVKAQTFKFGRQDKPKKPKGRARKRMQYERQFGETAQAGATLEDEEDGYCDEYYEEVNWIQEEELAKLEVEVAGSSDEMQPEVNEDVKDDRAGGSSELVSCE